MSIIQSECCVYEAEVQIDDPPNIIPDVIRTIRKLPRKMKAESEYIVALSIIGTHFMRKVTYGAYYAKLSVIKEKEAKQSEDRYRFFSHELNSCNECYILYINFSISI